MGTNILSSTQPLQKEKKEKKTIEFEFHSCQWLKGMSTTFDPSIDTPSYKELWVMIYFFHNDIESQCIEIYGILLLAWKSADRILSHQKQSLHQLEVHYHQLMGLNMLASTLLFPVHQLKKKKNENCVLAKFTTRSKSLLECYNSVQNYLENK